VDSDSGPLTILGETEESCPPVAASAGNLLTIMCRGSLTSLAYSESGPLTVLGEAEEEEESCPSGSVAASAGDLLITMRRCSQTSLADWENGSLTVLGEAEDAEDSRPSGPGATLLVILDSNLLTRLTRGFPVSAAGCTSHSALPLAPPRIGPSLTDSGSRVWS
jgi:hypothetical protein